MLKRIWHAITGGHTWVEIAARNFPPCWVNFMHCIDEQRHQRCGFTEINWHCDCGASRTLRVSGDAKIDPVKDELAELRKMAGLK
jgi:hypothetical protein